MPCAGVQQRQATLGRTLDSIAASTAGLQQLQPRDYHDTLTQRLLPTHSSEPIAAAAVPKLPDAVPDAAQARLDAGSRHGGFEGSEHENPARLRRVWPAPTLTLELDPKRRDHRRDQVDEADLSFRDLTWQTTDLLEKRRERVTGQFAAVSGLGVSTSVTLPPGLGLDGQTVAVEFVTAQSSEDFSDVTSVARVTPAAGTNTVTETVSITSFFPGCAVDCSGAFAKDVGHLHARYRLY
jgi:hypothetical protein